MKKLIVFIVVVVLIGGAATAYFLTGHKHVHGSDAATKESSQSEGEQLYTCGMHPQVIQDKPGNCPICGMKLTPIRKDGGVGASLSTITIDPVTEQNMGIRTALVSKGPVRRVIRTVGVIEPDESSLAEVTTKFKGWIEELYVDATGQQVHEGDPLFEIYSPELYSAQTEYLLAYRASEQPNAKTNSLLSAATVKLKYFDISDQQIRELEKSGEAKKTLQVTAPQDGFVLEKKAVEGRMVSAGETLYRLADLSLVWVQSEIYEKDLPYVKLGQEAVVTLSYLPDRKFRGRVTYVYPTVDPKTRTARVRMEFHNPGYFLKPGMFATVELRAELAPSALLVPEEAVLRSGERNTVFVALDQGKFSPRTVKLGARAEDDTYQVLGGLEEGERVVVSGQFMLDSESQLREAIQKMVDPGRSVGASERGEPQSAEALSTLDGYDAPGSASYVCPMPEHVSIVYEKPGDCPLCGMKLVPVSQDLLSKLASGGEVEAYTCPMPEHSHIRLESGGKCPECGMTLIPVVAEVEPQEPPLATQPLPTLFTCPMKSHAHIVSDEPGLCPECDMKLVETSTVAHGEIAEGHWRKSQPADVSRGEATDGTAQTLYTCPMKSHAHIVSDEPGLCPECEMKLVETKTVEHGKTAEENWRKQHPTPPADSPPQAAEEN